MTEGKARKVDEMSHGEFGVSYKCCWVNEDFKTHEYTCFRIQIKGDKT